jgi:hypothetical protein
LKKANVLLLVVADVGFGPRSCTDRIWLSLPSPPLSRMRASMLFRVEYHTAKSYHAVGFFVMLETSTTYPSDYIFFEGMTQAAIVLVRLPLIA